MEKKQNHIIPTIPLHPLGGMTAIDLKYENYGTLKPLQNQGPNPFFFFIASTVLTFATIYWPEQKPPMERTSMETGNWHVGTFQSLVLGCA